MKKFIIEIDKGEMPGMTETTEVSRKNIGPGGALGLWDGFGRMVIRVDGEPVALLHVHEGEDGGAVLDIRDGREALITRVGLDP